MAGEGFPPELRLRRSAQFQEIRQRGWRRHTPHFLVIVMGRPEGPTRLGITVSRKVGNAVRRNRVKRLLREYFRTSYPSLPPHSDLSIIGKPGSPFLTLEQVAEELHFLMSLRDRRVDS